MKTTGVLIMLVMTSTFSVAGCDTESGGVLTGAVLYHGSHPCTTNADCPQYYSLCLPYEGTCEGSPIVGLEVGDCGCYESGIVDKPCECEPCGGRGEYLEVGISLCARYEVACDSDADCPGTGLHCWDLTGTCSPNPDGHLECSDDADCLYGWECIDNPEELRPITCDTQGNETSTCCAKRVCAPRGWKLPLIGCS